jgi:hypothetical protein
MADGLVLLILAVVLFVVLGPFKINNVRVNNAQRYNPNNYRFTTPGRNERQRQLAERRKDAKSSSDPQGVQLENFVDGGNATVVEQGEVMEHPELTRKVMEDVNIPQLLCWWRLIISQERARRVAAAEARMKKDKTNAEIARRHLAERKAQKGRSALEQASLENQGWRDADRAHEMRSYN